MSKRGSQTLLDFWKPLGKQSRIIASEVGEMNLLDSEENCEKTRYVPET
jgi:hypothetical protein